MENWSSTVRSEEFPAWFSFWFYGCWRALAKGTAWAGFIAQLFFFFYPPVALLGLLHSSPTPQDVGPYFRRNFISCGYGRD